MLARPRPILAALLIALAAECLFLWGIATPHEYVFDETHYVPAARVLLQLAGPTNTEHPLVGKEFIAAGIALLGDNSFGWRFFSTIAASATLSGVFAILWLLFRRMRTALLGTAFALLNFTLYIQARIAMLDTFLAAFTVLAVAAMLWSMDAPQGKVWPRWILAGMLFGLAIGSKWAAVPYLGFAGIAFLIARRRGGWPGLPVIPALAVLGGVALATYILTFLPAFFYHDQPLTLAHLIAFHQQMYAEQTQVLPHHTYQSDWWSWPLLIRPIWYLYEHADGAMRGILMLGNPAIMWGGLVAVMACLWGGWRAKDGRLATAGWLWIAAYVPYAIIPKSLGFYYYYYVPSIALPIALAAAWDRYAKGRLTYWDEGYAVLCVGVAMYFFPILSAAPLSGDYAFRHWMWFPSWP